MSLAREAEVVNHQERGGTSARERGIGYSSPLSRRLPVGSTFPYKPSSEQIGPYHHKCPENIPEAYNETNLDSMDHVRGSGNEPLKVANVGANNSSPSGTTSFHILKRDKDSALVGTTFYDLTPQPSLWQQIPRKRPSTLHSSKTERKKYTERATTDKDPGSNNFTCKRLVDSLSVLNPVVEDHKKSEPVPSAFLQENFDSVLKVGKLMKRFAGDDSALRSVLMPTRQNVHHISAVNSDAEAAAAYTNSSEDSIPVSNNRRHRAPLDISASELLAKHYGWVWGDVLTGSEPKDAEIWDTVQHLGHGSLGVVDEVRRANTQLPTLVRKQVKLPAQKRMAERIKAIVQDEAAVLRRLCHPNIITLLGSYEDTTNSRHSAYCLLMIPVGENDLERFLAMASDSDLSPDLKVRHQTWIRSWYVDLASALMYMHSSGVRHQDIKPSNIIHKGGHVFFTDFSSSGNFKVGQTTSTANPARSTAMYAAPETSINATGSYPRHGRALDVFGLGCVFCDMLSVQESRPIWRFHDFLCNSKVSDAQETPCWGNLRYREVLPRISDWFDDSDIFIDCISRMLEEQRELRLSASDVWFFFLAVEDDY